MLKCILMVIAMIYCTENLATAATQTTQTLPAPLFQHLGNYHRTITTDNPKSQRYFDQGMVLFYGFEWGEAARSFRAAIKLDPSCAMCYWGLVMALTYKGNEPNTGHEMQEAKAAIEKASALAPYGNSQEQAYIRALAIKYSQAKLSSQHKSLHHMGQPTNNAGLQQFLSALDNVVKQYPDDSDAKVVYATALFWNMVEDPKEAEKTAQQIIMLLQPVLKKDPEHIGANHYFIHAVEGTPHPEMALESAQRLETLVPDSEHLVHMPSHIYFLTGRFHAASNSNQQAIAAYQRYQKVSKAQGFEPQVTFLYHHDLDFLRSSAVMEGRKSLALSAANQLIENLPSAWIAKNPDLQFFIPIPSFVKARFGMWPALLQTPMPASRYQYALGMWYYATGLAYINTGDTKQAEKATQALQKIIANGPIPANLGKLGLTLLSIAYNVLNAALENNLGNKSATLAYLKKADQLQVSLRYHEPPDWYFPVKEGIGDVYLKWKQPKDALAMYQAVLKQYPNNGWALFGVMKSQEQLGETEKATKTREAFKAAWQYADIPEPVPLFH